ncbi:hypothetical protein Tco_0328508 [Tanacetum coccineum]
MSMQQLQVNTKFVNHLQPEWSKFVMDVKLTKDLHSTNFDHLYAYLRHHEAHTNEVRLMRQRYPDPLALVANTYNSSPSYTSQTQYHQQLSPIAQQYYSPPAQQQSNDVPMVQQRSYQCTKPKRPRNSAWFKEKMLLAEALESGVVLDEEYMEFLADNGDTITIGKDSQEIPTLSIF